MWQQIKGGLTGAQEGEGLPQQPTALGNASQFAGLLGTQVAALGLPEDFNAAERIAKPALETVVNALPDMPATKLAHASDMFNQVASAVGDNPVKLTAAMKDSLDAIKEASDLGSGGGSIANKVMTRLTNGENVPLSYKEARTLYSNLGELTTSDRMASNKNMLRLLNQFRSQLGGAIESTAEGSGQLPQYQQAMKSWANAADQQEKLNTIIDWAKKTGIAATGITASGGLGAAGWDLYQRLFGK